MSGASVQFFSILWRGIRDWYDQFVYFMILSVAFSVCAFPAVFGLVFAQMSVLYLPVAFATGILIPPAVTTLFALTDPRQQFNRPEWREVLTVYRLVFVRSWKIALVTILPLVIITWNIAYFGGSSHMLALMVPLWVVMWILLFALTLYMFCLAGTHESGVKNAFRGGMFVLVKYPFRALGLALLIVTVGYVFWVALLPMVLIGPALFAAIVNRFVFAAFDVYVLDPNQPTDERQWEKERGINIERGLVDRVIRREKR